MLIVLTATLLTACGGNKDEEQNNILEGKFDEGDPAVIAIPIAIHTVNMLNNQFRVGHSQLKCDTTGCTASGSALGDTLTILFDNYTSGYSAFTGTVAVDSSGENPSLQSSDLKTTVFRQFAQSDHTITLTNIKLTNTGKIIDGLATLDGSVQSAAKMENDQSVFFTYATLAASYALVNNVSRICTGEKCASKDRLHAIVNSSKGNKTTLSQTRTYNMTGIATYLNETMGNFQLKHSQNTENLTQNKLVSNLVNNDVYLKYNIYEMSGVARLDQDETTFEGVSLLRRQSQYQRNETLMNLKGRALFRDNYVTFVESSSQCTHLTNAFHVLKATPVPQNIAKRYEEFGEILYLQTDLSGSGGSDITLMIKREPLDKCDSGAPIFQIIGPVDGLIGGSATLSNPNVNGGEPWSMDELFLNIYYDPYVISNTAQISTYFYK